MMSERWLWDRFIYQVRESGMIPDGGEILDVGTGENTTMLEMFGDRWDVTPSDVNVGEWNSHIPGMLQLDVMTLQDQLADRPKFDAVILSEVLEHVTDPADVLYQCGCVLKPGGHLILSTPFMYRIHEKTPEDPETTEPGLKDYWRFTPNGLALLFSRQVLYDQCWVGRLVEGDRKDFPAFQCPMGIVAWARRGPDNTVFAQIQLSEDAWSPWIPEDWRDQQIRMAGEYDERTIRRMVDAREQVDSV